MLVFSSTIPVITLAGFLFYFIKHIVDSFNLLTYHRKEMESKATVFKNIIFSAQICLILFQSVMLAYFSSNSFLGEAFCVAFTLCITVIIFCLVNQEVFEPEKDSRPEDGRSSNYGTCSLR